jgi:restriction endonuclease S subunit
MMFYKETEFQETPIGKISSNWSTSKLGVLVKIETGKRAKGGGLDEGNVASIGGEHIDNQGRIIWNGMKFIPDDFYNLLKEGKVKLGDILLVKDGATTGKVAFVRELKYEKVAVNEHVFVIRSKTEHLANDFLFYFLLSKYGQSQIKKSFHGIIGGITRDELETIFLPIPPLEEQKAITRVLDVVDSIIAKTDEVIAKTERLKKGLMQELLTKGLILGFMFDTNIFDEILDKKVELPENLKYYVSHIQYDEILNISIDKKERKEKLLEIFDKVPKEVIATEGSTVGVSKVNSSKVMSKEDNELYNKMLEKLKELDEKSGKKKIPENQARDILIALTSIKNCLILVTEDENLKKVTEEFNGQAITFEQFQKREYREFKDTEIGRIPKHWKVVKVSDVLSLEYGRGLPEKERIPGMYPVVGSNGIVGYHNQAIVKGPGIVIGRKGTIGAISWIDKDFWPIDTTYYVKTKISDVFLKWLFYELIYLNPARFHLADVVPGLKRELVHQLKMPLPSLQEQQKIAEILSIIDKKLDVEKNEKAKLEKIKQGLMDLLLTGKIRVKI